LKTLYAVTHVVVSTPDFASLDKVLAVAEHGSLWYKRIPASGSLS
jgi:hypothetical protein